MDLHNSHMDKGVLAKGKTITIDCIINDTENLPETTIGQRVRKLRLLKNYTIKDLAAKIEVSEETISNIEKSLTTPNISTLNKISQGLISTNNYILNTDKWPEDSQGEIIYKYRMINGMSQRDLAKKCNLHNSTIRDYENNIISNPEKLKIIYEYIGYI